MRCDNEPAPWVPNWDRPLLRLRGFLTPEEGARTTLHCAIHAPQKESCLYYADPKPMQPVALEQNSALAAELWRRREVWIKHSYNNLSHLG